MKTKYKLSEGELLETFGCPVGYDFEKELVYRDIHLVKVQDLESNFSQLVICNSRLIGKLKSDVEFESVAKNIIEDKVKDLRHLGSMSFSEVYERKK